MKYLLIFGVFVSASKLLAQDANLFYQDTITAVSDKCDQELEKANNDFNNGTYVIELRKPIPFSNTQQKVLSDRYGVIVVFTDGLMSPNHDCYNYHLKTLAKQKWNHDIFKRSKFLADSLDRLGFGDQEANFKDKGGFAEFLKRNLCNNSKTIIRQIKDERELYIKVDISEEGYADNVAIINSLHFGEIEIEILDLVKGIKLWVPKKDDGQGIKTTIIYSIAVKEM
jgi:hypothetical protein